MPPFFGRLEKGKKDYAKKIFLYETGVFIFRVNFDLAWIKEDPEGNFIYKFYDKAFKKQILEKRYTSIGTSVPNESNRFTCFRDAGVVLFKFL